MRFVRQRQTASPMRILILVICGYIVFLYFFLIVIINIYEASGQTLQAIYQDEEYLQLHNQLLKDKIVKNESFNSVYQRAIRSGFIPLLPSQIKYIK